MSAPAPPRCAPPRAPTAALAAATVLGSYLAVRAGVTAPLDDRVEAALARHDPRAGDVAVATATDLGSSYGLAGMVVSLAATGHRRLAVEVAAAGGTAWGLAQAVKPVLPRVRPYQRGGAPRLVSPPAGSAWPSGHAAVAAAMARAISRRRGPVAGLATAAGAGAVGASRVAVGVHHASDVVAGLGVGVVAAEAAAFATGLGVRWVTRSRRR